MIKELEILKWRKEFAKICDEFTKAYKLDAEQQPLSDDKRRDYTDRQLLLYFQLHETLIGLKMVIVANGIPEDKLHETLDKWLTKTTPILEGNLKKTMEKIDEKNKSGVGM